MNIVNYTTTDDVPEHKRHLAQFTGINKHLIFSFYGATAAEARGKAQAFWDKEIAPKIAKSAEKAPDSVQPVAPKAPATPVQHKAEPEYDPLEDLL